MVKDSKIQNWDQNRAQAVSQAGRGKEKSGVVTVSERTKIVTTRTARIKVRVDRLPPPKRAWIELKLDDGSIIVIEGSLESAYGDKAYYKALTRYIDDVIRVKDRVKEARLIGEGGAQ